MNLRRIVLAGVFLDCAVAVVTAGAALFVSADACTAPAAATPYIPPADIIADTPRVSGESDYSVVILKDISLDGRRGDGLFARLALDYATGQPRGAGENRPEQKACAE